MENLITIAVDAMGGDNSPTKIIDGIELHSKKSKNIFYKIFGDRNIINPIIERKKLNENVVEIIHTEEKVKGEDSAFAAAKRGKNTSMWLAIESVKNKSSDIVISAGNTGALLVIAKLNLKMLENIDKPALSGLWPSKKGMSVVLDLGANIELFIAFFNSLVIKFAVPSAVFNAMLPVKPSATTTLTLPSIIWLPSINPINSKSSILI